MKATEQYFPVVLFIMLYKVVLTFESVDEILMCDHSNESYWAVLSCGDVYYAVQGGSNVLEQYFVLYHIYSDAAQSGSLTWFKFLTIPCKLSSVQLYTM